MLNEDYKEMLQHLLDSKVRFLVVGAYAMGAHGYPRATGDIDIWVEPTKENARRTYTALAAFGAPLNEITQATFSEQKICFQIGVAPRRIDIITHIDGVIFKDAYEGRELLEIEKMTIPFLSKEALIKNKLSTGREKDSVDVKYLKKKK